ncbi:MAG: MFS transporter, partial [Candidatus Binatia bacterium]
MAKPQDPHHGVDSRSLLSKYHFLTLYLPAVSLALGHGVALPAIPVFAKSFGTGFGIASLVIVVHSFGSLISTLPTGFLLDKVGRRPILLSGPILTALSSFLIAT